MGGGQPTGVGWTVVGPPGGRAGCSEERLQKLCSPGEVSSQGRSVFLQVATKHEIGYKACHSIWSKMGNY